MKQRVRVERRAMQRAICLPAEQQFAAASRKNGCRRALAHISDTVDQLDLSAHARTQGGAAQQPTGDDGQGAATVRHRGILLARDCASGTRMWPFGCWGRATSGPPHAERIRALHLQDVGCVQVGKLARECGLVKLGTNGGWDQAQGQRRPAQGDELGRSARSKRGWRPRAQCRAGAAHRPAGGSQPQRTPRRQRRERPGETRGARAQARQAEEDAARGRKPTRAPAAPPRAAPSETGDTSASDQPDDKEQDNFTDRTAHMKRAGGGLSSATTRKRRWMPSNRSRGAE